MQTHPLQTLYPQFQGVLGALPDNTNSLCLYSSTDRVHFHAYPQPTFGFPTSTFATVLPELRTLFAVQATGPFIRAAIESATMLQHEVEIGCGYSVRIVDDATHLVYAAGHCQSSAFVRADACLVVWADCVDTVMASWSDIACCLQSRFGDALLHSSPMAGLSGSTYGDSLSIDQFLQTNIFDLPLGSSQPFTDALSSLNEFSFLETVHGPTTPSPTLASATSDANSYANPAWLWGQSESPGVGVLELALQTLNTSDPSLANDISYNFEAMPLTVNPASISPPPVGELDLSQEEDPCSSSDGTSSRQQPSFTFSTDVAPGPPSFRRHSVGAQSARVVGKKTKRDSDDDDDQSEYNYVDDSYSPTDAAHTSKRRRAAGDTTIIVKATSAPARFMVPLPNVHDEKNDCDDDDDGGSSVTSSTHSSLSQLLEPLTPLSTSTSTSTSLFPSPSPTSTPARAAPRRARRRAGTSGGASARARRRTQCEFCPKTFTRAQDAQRHAERTCDASPNKTGVQCPECGHVLSRLDAAQRHWRGHENPRCAPPEWANERM